MQPPALHADAETTLPSTAPPAGGQLLGKGVDVENYPGLLSQTGAGVVQLMRTQSRAFGMRRATSARLSHCVAESNHSMFPTGDADRHRIFRLED
eukprot:COSAG02_NODE_11008_length_1819_cov_0.920653_3_plen_95_part_00